MTPALLYILLGGIDPDAANWATRVISNGGSVSNQTLKAVSTFSKQAKAAGLWALFNRINLFAGDQLAAALVPLLAGGGSATDANTNFVAADYTQVTGLTGNSTSKSLNTGLVGSTFTGASLHVASYGASFANSGGSLSTTAIGAADAANGKIIAVQTRNLTVPGLRGFAGDVTNVSSGTLAAAESAFIGISAISTTDLRSYKNGAQSGSTQTGARSGAALTAASFVVFAYNLNGVISGWESCSMRAYSIGLGLTAANWSDYNTIMETFQKSLGRGVQ